MIAGAAISRLNKQKRKKGRTAMENINGVKQITEDTIISLEVEELESRIAPATAIDYGRIVSNHNETMLEDMVEVEELESRIAPATAVPLPAGGKLAANHNETKLEDMGEVEELESRTAAAT